MEENEETILLGATYFGVKYQNYLYDAGLMRPTYAMFLYRLNALAPIAPLDTCFTRSNYTTVKNLCNDVHIFDGDKYEVHSCTAYV